MNAMRKVRSGGVWVLGLALLGLALPVAAQDKLRDGDYIYKAVGGYCTITGYSGPGGDITIPSTLGGHRVWEIGDFGFSGKTSITSVIFPASMKVIGEMAFDGCTGLTRVTIPAADLGYSAFRGCTRLRTVKLGAGVDGFNYTAINNCPSLMAFVVSVNNSVLSSLDGVLFNKAKTELIMFPAGKGGKYTVPKSVRRIGAMAFSQCLRLTGVQMGNRVSTIGDWEFGFCPSLTGVMIGSGLRSIGGNAFAICRSLTTVCIGGNAPPEAADVFEDSPLVTVYYLPWTTGWGATFGGRPTKAGDRYEPDNSKSAAQVIRNGKTQIHCIHEARNADWVKFTVGGAGALNLKLDTVGASGNTEMWLYNASNRQIAYDDDSGPGSFSRIRVASLPPGTYYAKIRGYGNGTVPFFWLSASWTQR